MNTAIIVAAGSGKRFGGKIPKQFLPIHGKPLINYTLERFESCDLIDEIVLVVSESEIRNLSNYFDKDEFVKLRNIVSGGKSRAESVFNGLKSLDEKTADIIAIHDGARPLVSVQEITETVKTAKEKGAACLVAAVTDTIKEVANGMVVKTINRSALRRALTPQCFRYEVLRRAFKQIDLSETVTDECYLVEKLGFEIALVEGSGRNIKITTKDDFLIAETLLK